MSVLSDLKAADPIVQAGVALVIIFVAYNVYQSLFGSSAGGSTGLLGTDPADTQGDPNSVGDTSTSDYAGFGVLGNFASGVNKLLGGIPQSIGSSIASALPGSGD